jgi:hypothetical protein
LEGHLDSTYRVILEPAKTISRLFMIILPNGQQNRLHKVLPVLIGRTHPPTATATISIKTQISSIIIRHQILLTTLLTNQRIRFKTENDNMMSLRHFYTFIQILCCRGSTEKAGGC